MRECVGGWGAAMSRIFSELPSPLRPPWRTDERGVWNRAAFPSNTLSWLSSHFGTQGRKSLSISRWTRRLLRGMKFPSSAYSPAGRNVPLTEEEEEEAGTQSVFVTQQVLRNALALRIP